MKKSAVAIAILMANSVGSVQAGDTPSVDKSLGQFANSILGTWQPAPGSVSNEQPNVDKSLGLFAGSILGGSPRLPEAQSNGKGDVDKSLGLFATSILN